MMQCGLFDGSFTQKCATAGGDNIDDRPEYIEWMRGHALPVTFFTDMWLDHVKNFGSEITKVALLFEASGQTQTAYVKALELEEYFDYILCHEYKWYLSEDGRMQRRKWYWYPFGGSYIKYEDWSIKPKDKMVSMITTEKRVSRGHALRHEIERMTEAFPIDVMFPGLMGIQTKPEAKHRALESYRYSIIVENSKERDYFSEKIIDCFSQGTIPIYWGSPDIGKHFDMGGIIPFDTTIDLSNILINIVNEEDYSNRLGAIQKNIKTAEQYRRVEDWIFNNYPGIFDAGRR